MGDQGDHRLMPYLALQDLIDRFGERALIALTDRGEYAQGAIDQPTIDRAIADTDAVIDAYLAKRYALPLTPAQPLVKDLALAIAFWKLHGHTPDPKVEADYKEALRQLQQLATGTMVLAAAGVPEAGGTGGTGARITDRERPFTEGNLKGFI